MCRVAQERQRYSHVLIAEKIRTLEPRDARYRAATGEKLPLTPEEEKERENRAVQKAREKFAAEMASEAGNSATFVQAFFYFEELTHDPSIAVALQELMRQGIVLAWSAIEALANDLFRSLLNDNPTLSEALFHDERTKKRFQLRDAMGILASRNYNLSDHMGDVLNECCKLDDVDSIRCVFDALFPNGEKLRNTLADERLWKLFQRRNLIVHRRGIVDQMYIDNTGDNVALGSELAISPADVDTATLILFVAGLELLETVSRNLGQGG